MQVMYIGLALVSTSSHWAVPSLGNWPCIIRRTSDLTDVSKHHDESVRRGLAISTQISCVRVVHAQNTEDRNHAAHPMMLARVAFVGSTYEKSCDVTDTPLTYGCASIHWKASDVSTDACNVRPHSTIHGCYSKPYYYPIGWLTDGVTGSCPKTKVAEEMDEASHKKYEPRPQSVVSLHIIVCYARYDAGNH